NSSNSWNCGATRSLRVRQIAQQFEGALGAPEMRPQQRQIFPQPTNIVGLGRIFRTLLQLLQYRTKDNCHRIPPDGEKRRTLNAGVPCQQLSDFGGAAGKPVQVWRGLLGPLWCALYCGLYGLNMRVLRHVGFG